VLAQVFGSGKPSSSLSAEERLSAIGTGLRSTTLTPEEAWLAAGVLAGAVLLVAFAAWIVASARRQRWVAHHLRALAASGLHDAELAPSRALGRRASAVHLPLLTRRATTYDQVAADLVRRHRPASERRDLLARLLALRRRIPFARDDRGNRGDPPGASLGRGQPIAVCLRFGRGETLKLPGRVVAAPPHALQLALDPSAESLEVSRLLRTGQDVTLVVQRGIVLEEARVRIRGLGGGTPPQLLVDRPAALAPSRVRIVWSGADERVRVEMLERYSERFVSDDVPAVDARVVATASEGVVLVANAARPRHGEAIRIVDGARAGVYRGYALLDAKGNGGEFFVMRRGSREPEERNEPVARAS